MDPAIITELPLGLRSGGHGFLRRPLLGGVEILGRRLRREFDLGTEPSEAVRLCVRGLRGHALVCLDDRILILKHGLRAGTTFGAMSATIFYRDVTGIQVGLHLGWGWIEIQSPSFQGRDRNRLSRSRQLDRDAFKQANCVPIRRRHVPVYQLALAELRRFVVDANGGPHPRGGVVDQLERLAVLRREGAVDDREFELAKLRILDPVFPP